MLLSGCDDPEYSFDAWIGGRYRGAFTAAALDALAEGPRTVKAWHQGIRERLPSQVRHGAPAPGVPADTQPLVDQGFALVSGL